MTDLAGQHEEFPSAPVWDAKDVTDDEIERFVAANGGNSCVQVVYSVPLLVEVDLMTGTVTRVREVIEEVSYPEPVEIYADPNSLAPLEDERLAELALTISEDADWPAWEAKL